MSLVGVCGIDGLFDGDGSLWYNMHQTAYSEGIR